MAVKDVALTPIELNGISEAITFEAGTAADGFDIDFTKADNKIVILFNASAAGTASITAGEMIQGVNDVVVTVPEGVSAAVVDSGAFKRVDGKVNVKPSANTIKVAAILLP